MQRRELARPKGLRYTIADSFLTHVQSGCTTCPRCTQTAQPQGGIHTHQHSSRARYRTTLGSAYLDYISYVRDVALFTLPARTPTQPQLQQALGINHPSPQCPYKSQQTRHRRDSSGEDILAEFAVWALTYPVRPASGRDGVLASMANSRDWELRVFKARRVWRSVSSESSHIVTYRWRSFPAICPGGFSSPRGESEWLVWSWSEGKSKRARPSECSCVNPRQSRVKSGSGARTMR